MHIQSLVFDLDGTAIPNDPKGRPSQRVIEAVQYAKKFCHVSVATGRPLSICSHILQDLQIDDLCILNGGTHLYSRKTKTYLWEKEMDKHVVETLFSRLRKFSIYEAADEKHMERVALGKYRCAESIGLCCIFSVTEEDSKEMLSSISDVEGTLAHMVPSWQEGLFDIHITHELATKKHALQALLGYQSVRVDNVMVVGDGGNDLPLFELAGLKIAMGNGSPALKEKADWIAPSVAEDGLAIAIEKFIGENL